MRPIGYTPDLLFRPEPGRAAAERWTPERDDNAGFPIRPTGLLMTAVLTMAAIIGYAHGRASVQDANALLDAGFTITDPEGHEVARFDD